MLGVRRVLAVMLTAPLVVTFAVALAAGRVDATLLDDGYLRDRVHDADVYALAYDELTGEWVDGYIDDPEALPERLQAMGLPSDLDARGRMVELVQALIPLAVLQGTGDQALAVIPWITGKSDGFEVTIELREGLIATFGHAPGAPSLFQEAWLDFEMGGRMVTGFIGRVAERGAGPPAPGEEPRAPLTAEERAALDAILGTQLPQAAAWWDGQLFAIIDGLLPYLTGDSDDLDINIEFEAFPDLALAFSDMLGEDAEVLRTEGWQFTEEDLQARLAESGDVTIADVDHSLAIFRKGGATFDQDDLVRRMQAERTKQQQPSEMPEGLPTDVTADDGPMDILELRETASRVRLALRWGTVLLATVLTAAIAILGGKHWPSRIAWGAGALLVASGVTYAVTSIIMAVLLRSRVDQWVEDQRAARADGLGEVVRVRAVEVIRGTVDDIVGGMQTRALLWAALALITVGLAVMWPRPAFQDVVRRVRGAPPEATG